MELRDDNERKAPVCNANPVTWLRHFPLSGGRALRQLPWSVCNCCYAIQVSYTRLALDRLATSKFGLPPFFFLASSFLPRVWLKWMLKDGCCKKGRLFISPCLSALFLRKSTRCFLLAFQTFSFSKSLHLKDYYLLPSPCWIFFFRDKMVSRTSLFPFNPRTDIARNCGFLGYRWIGCRLNLGHFFCYHHKSITVY